MDEHSTPRPASEERGDRAERVRSGNVPPPLALTAGQRRAIAAMLLQVAHAVAHIETLLHQPLGEPIRYVVTRNDMDGAEREWIMAAATELVREANALAEVCAIPPRYTDVRATLGGEFSILWSDAVDTGPSRLTGYGVLKPESAAAIAPHVSAIARLSMLIARRAQGRAT